MHPFVRFTLGYLCMLLTALSLVAVLAGMVLGSVAVSLRLAQGSWDLQDQWMGWSSLAGLLLGATILRFSNPLSHRLLSDIEEDGQRTFIFDGRGGSRKESDAQWMSLIGWFAIFSGWALYSSLSDNLWVRILETVLAASAFWLALHVRILLHELGHLGMASALGMERVQLRVGSGPILWQSRSTKFGRMAWEWRVRPAGGWMMALHPSGSGFRWRQWVFVAGGPLMDAALLWVSYKGVSHQWGSWSESFQRGVVGATAGAWLWVFFMMAINSLMPYKTHIGGKALFTDGWWLLRLPWLKPAVILDLQLQQALARTEAFRSAGRLEQAWQTFREIRASFPEKRAILAHIEGALRKEERDFAGAAECYARALAEPNVNPAYRIPLQVERIALLTAAGQSENARRICAEMLESASAESKVEWLDGLACLPIMHGAKDFLPDAQIWIEQAIALNPQSATLGGTCAALLVERGQLDEAEPILRKLYDEGKVTHDRGIAAFYLAIIARRRNAPEREWKRWRRLALRLHPEPWLVERVRLELADLTATVAA